MSNWKHCRNPECDNELGKNQEKFCSKECHQYYRSYYKSKKGLRKDAWDLMSEWLRRKNAGHNEMATCYTCGKSQDWRKMNGGHNIHGVTKASYLEEDNVRVQCVGCNKYHNGKLNIYTKKLIKEIGMERYEELEKKSRETYTKDELREKKKYYEKKLKELEDDNLTTDL